MAEKKSNRSPDELRRLVDSGHPQLSVRRQCPLLGLCRSSLYYQGVAESSEGFMYLAAILDWFSR